MSEQAEIKRDGAKAQKNSGRDKTQKGDAVLGRFLYDIKEYSKGFSVNRTVWAKACTDALSGRKVPALKLVLGEPGNRIRLWVIDDHTFKEMNDLWEKEYGE